MPTQYSWGKEDNSTRSMHILELLICGSRMAVPKHNASSPESSLPLMCLTVKNVLLMGNLPKQQVKKNSPASELYVQDRTPTNAENIDPPNDRWVDPLPEWIAGVRRLRREMKALQTKNGSFGVLVQTEGEREVHNERLIATTTRGVHQAGTYAGKHNSATYAITQCQCGPPLSLGASLCDRPTGRSLVGEREFEHQPRRRVYYQYLGDSRYS